MENSKNRVIIYGGLETKPNFEISLQYYILNEAIYNTDSLDQEFSLNEWFHLGIVLEETIIYYYKNGRLLYKHFLDDSFEMDVEEENFVLGQGKQIIKF